MNKKHGLILISLIIIFSYIARNTEAAESDGSFTMKPGSVLSGDYPKLSVQEPTIQDEEGIRKLDWEIHFSLGPDPSQWDRILVGELLTEKIRHSPIRWRITDESGNIWPSGTSNSALEMNWLSPDTLGWSINVTEDMPFEMLTDKQFTIKLTTVLDPVLNTSENGKEGFLNGAFINCYYDHALKNYNCSYTGAQAQNASTAFKRVSLFVNDIEPPDSDSLITTEDKMLDNYDLRALEYNSPEQSVSYTETPVESSLKSVYDDKYRDLYVEGEENGLLVNDPIPLSPSTGISEYGMEITSAPDYREDPSTYEYDKNALVSDIGSGIYTNNNDKNSLATDSARGLNASNIDNSNLTVESVTGIYTNEYDKNALAADFTNDPYARNSDKNALTTDSISDPYAIDFVNSTLAPEFDMDAVRIWDPPAPAGLPSPMPYQNEPEKYVTNYDSSFEFDSRLEYSEESRLEYSEESKLEYSEESGIADPLYEPFTKNPFYAESILSSPAEKLTRYTSDSSLERSKNDYAYGSTISYPQIDEFLDVPSVTPEPSASPVPEIFPETSFTPEKTVYGSVFSYPQNDIYTEISDVPPEPSIPRIQAISQETLNNSSIIEYGSSSDNLQDDTYLFIEKPTEYIQPNSNNLIKRSTALETETPPDIAGGIVQPDYTLSLYNSNSEIITPATRPSTRSSMPKAVSYTRASNGVSNPAANGVSNPAANGVPNPIADEKLNPTTHEKSRVYDIYIYLFLCVSFSLLLTFNKQKR